ncbi:hypothetical protein [Mesorhizobium sp. M7A.F.Ca.US.008.03.1.1]|uniref:hypothetical protein n=1 Tax=Mesorhizobium sp. M7A.F.Ca.US.008.03.1.1 TaxID=2496742 RepID=UPI000FCB8C15|nr:hypothetical protein [Mesorhizobium sp. M7A.F.Ca.US.008.03.1.1]RUW62208.1 hypothetical protein EOA16_08175 [Mesorhizobium sp. M7A.F.Ca.US.008.03.1.1]
MSVRILMGIVLAAVTGGAQASSLVFPGAPSSTPSIVRVGAPNQPKTAEVAKTKRAPSVLALGAVEPEVTYEKVAAIPDKPATGFQPGPMVIRGGVTGPDFPAPAPAAAPATGAAPAASKAPEAGTAPATATASAAPSGNAESQPTPPSPPAQTAGQRMPPNGYSK